MTDLKVGDVVMLKSGGPNMTVEEVSEDGNSVSCVWFNRPDGEATREVFGAAILLKGQVIRNNTSSSKRKSAPKTVL